MILFRLPAHLCFKAGRRCCTYFVNSRRLTIRSSRARFAVSGVPSRIARAGLTQALAGCRQAFSRSRLRARSSQRGSSKFRASFGHQLGKSGLPALDHKRFLTRYVILGRAAGGVPGLLTQLTIPSSRHRFAAPAKAAKIVPYRRRKAVRLNSGVRRHTDLQGGRVDESKTNCNLAPTC